MIVTSWAAMIVGTALWGCGLFVTGTAPIIDWKSNAPWWIADYLPNMESELGLVLVCLGVLRLTGRAGLEIAGKKAPETKRFLRTSATDVRRVRAYLSTRSVDRATRRSGSGRVR